jgi:hypothetical protein
VPEFPQRMPTARAPADEGMRVAAALAKEGDDAIGELAEGHGIEGAASSQSMMSAPWPPIRSRRSRVAPSAAAWAGFRVSAACSISLPTKVLLRSPGQPLRMACASAHLASIRKGISAQRPGLVEDLAVGRLVVDPDRLEGREFLPTRDARDGEPLPVGVLPDPDRATDEAGGVGVGFESVLGLGLREPLRLR